MGRTKSKLMNIDGNLVMKKVAFTKKEEEARDIEEAIWNAAALEREREAIIEVEFNKLKQEEDENLRQQAERNLRLRGEIDLEEE